MKYISLITGSELRMVMGVNYFIKSFLQSNEYLNDVKINRAYSSLQTLKVDEGDEMPIGSDIGTTEYKFRRGVRTFLRKLLTDKFYPFALFKYELNYRTVSKNSVSRFFADDAPCDDIIFQELGVAEYYFKHCRNYSKTKNIKTMLIIHSEDDSGSMLLETFKGFGRKDMERRFLKRRNFVYEHIDKVMYISRKAYEHSILPEEKKSYVYNGSPVVEFSQKERKDGLTQFVCVGTIDGRKGQDKILEALHLMDQKHLERLHVTFVGGGTKETGTRKMAENLGLSPYVTFTGRRNDVPDILRSMDVFIMPSTVEGLPMSAIEAMRAGLYLILTDTGGNAELCEEGCGSVCTRNPENIVSIMCDTMDSGILGREQKQRSRDRFMSHFSLECMAKGYEKVLNTL